eukprot:4249994-Pyramimonas_sp.AAC.1
MFAGPRQGNDSTICHTSGSVKLASTMSKALARSSAWRRLSGRLSSTSICSSLAAASSPPKAWARAAVAPWRCRQRSAVRPQRAISS